MYFAKRKIVWEVLQGPLKSKIEIQWDDITAIRAIMHDDEPGILEIELNQPPTFGREQDPQPRKHTVWQMSSDITNGQATKWRRHYVSFAPKILDKHYEKLLQVDDRLLELSRRQFPSTEYAYFRHAGPAFGISQLPFNLNGHGHGYGYGYGYGHGHGHGYESGVSPGLHCPYQTYMTAQSTPNPTVISGMDYPCSNNMERNYDFRNQSPQDTVWDQGISYPTENIHIQQEPLDFTSVTQGNQVFNPQNYHSSHETFFNEIETQLLEDTHIDVGTPLQQVESLPSSFLAVNDNYPNNNLAYHSQMDYQMTDYTKAGQVIHNSMTNWLPPNCDSTVDNPIHPPFVWPDHLDNAGDYYFDSKP